MNKTVLITGATGFTGRYIVEVLCKAGYTVTCFLRQNSDRKCLEAFPVEFAVGDLNEPESLYEPLRGKDVFVNVASSGFGHTPGIVDICERIGVKRTIFFSTTALFTTLPASTKKVRFEAEQAIKASNLDFTILRPTMIYGSIGDRNMIKLVRFIEKSPIVPVFGDGMSLQQPVFVRDLAKAVVQVLSEAQTVRKAYNLSGLEPLTYNEIIDTVARMMEKRVFKWHLPVSLSLLMVRLSSKLPGVPKFSEEQVLRLNENKAFSSDQAAYDFGYHPVAFAEGIRLEIEEYKQSLHNHC